MILASTGSPKIVNVGNGGFISTNKKENKMDEAKTYFQKAYDINKTSSLAKEIEKELENL